MQQMKKGARAQFFSTVSCAALLLSVAPLGAHAQTAAPSNEAVTIGEVIVTASRRAETVSKLPFNVTAYGGEQLQRSGVSDVAALTKQVPNFSIQDNGARTQASSIPIIRGLNASQAVLAGARYFQSPVGFYQGNAPITGAFPLYDLERVEVLRGPQGTLYGAGSLSGAVRLVPVDPKLGQFSGSASVSGGVVSHSKKNNYSGQAIVNIPLGEDAALRIGARHEYQAGFIDYHDVLKREGDNYLTGLPVLATPSDVANSPGVYFTQKDGNYAKTTGARAAFMWKPTDAFSLNLAYNYARSRGVGGNIDNSRFPGGPSPIDPRRTLQPTGEYERSLPSLEPWSRRSQLASLDASYDLGFATLATTMTYGKTHGQALNDSTVNLLGTPAGFYYTGTPANPRTVIPNAYPDRDRSYTQEFRLVSNAGSKFDYVVGAFFQQQRRYLGQFIYAPGADTQSLAAGGGSKKPIAAGGTYVPLYANSLAYRQETAQDFKDYSAYGELTWHITDAWQVTGGGRYFHQTFDQKLTAASSLFFFTLDERSGSKGNDQIFKLNTSYKYDGSNQVYATWSQGFRRGGANAFATTGGTLEPRELLSYAPDKTNNFELGAKGTFARIYYSADVFYVSWDKAQIDMQTPYNLTSVVLNAKKAASKGVELELNGPILDTGVNFNFGLAYAKARLSDSFAFAAGNGAGGVVANAIRGSKGDRLPGAPDWSGAVNFNYKQDLGDVGSLTYALGADFRSSTVNLLSSYSKNIPTRVAPGYVMLNGSVSFAHDGWEAQLYSSNLLDKRVAYANAPQSLTSRAKLGAWGDYTPVSRPREVGIRLTRRW